MKTSTHGDLNTRRLGVHTDLNESTFQSTFSGDNFQEANVLGKILIGFSPGPSTQVGGLQPLLESNFPIIEYNYSNKV